jgi:hypothetical protein
MKHASFPRLDFPVTLAELVTRGIIRMVARDLDGKMEGESLGR